MKRALAIGLVLLLASCGENMNEQKKLPPYRASDLLRGLAMLTPVPGTVARDGLPDSAPQPPVITAELVARGQNRFEIYCTPCHGRVGDGEGMVVQRGFPAPPSFHSDRLRAAPASHFYDVITNGYGAMYSYAARVGPADRWAIAAYIRALQLSQHMAVASLSPADRQALTPEGGR
jgi:mono/diheme cytochrome c family protein